MWHEFFDQESNNANNISRHYYSNIILQDIHPTESSGLIYLDVEKIQALIESSTFFNCTNNGYSGVFHGYYKSGSVIIEKCCWLYCTCMREQSTLTSEGQAFLILASEANLDDIQLTKDCSIANTIETGHDSRTVIALYRSSAFLETTNISRNKIYQVTAFQIMPQAISDKITGSARFVTVADNYARAYSIISFFSSNTEDFPECEISFCNILRNDQGSSSEGLLRARSNLMISHSCILENDKSNHQNSFIILYKTLTILNCTIERTKISHIKIQFNGNINTSNWQPQQGSFIYAIPHTENAFCEAQLDSVGTITRMTPKDLPKETTFDIKKKMCHYTQCPRPYYGRYSCFVFVFLSYKQ